MCKSRWKKWFFAFLVVLCLTTFFACSQEVPTRGLDIAEDEGQEENLTSQEIARMTTALNGVMDRVLSSGVSFSNQAIDDLLQNLSQYMAQEVARLKPTQREYKAFLSVLQRYTERENLSTKMLIDNLYVDMTSALGKDKYAILAHRFLLSYCDYQVQKYQQLYEQYGYSYLSEDIQRYRQKYRVLSADLSSTDLAALLNTYYIVGTVRSLTGQNDTESFLSTDEILMLVKAQNCTAVELDTDVWYELLTLSRDFVTDKYYAKIVETATGNGDIRLLAEGMNDFFALIRHVQMTLSAQNVQEIQQGKPVDSVILSLLSDDQLRKIDVFLSKGWHYDEYDVLAQKQYGDGYRQFAEQTEKLTIDRLLEARRGAPDVTTLLVGYLAGKSNALALEVQP